ncbi:hypothetical protein [Stieleria varia]|uniref:Uncharacterized protein n=1 Tax=Stieleria varia TaxID=2528005 RepID=A0A5C6AGW9_9BACT|nr:hypothetical protein [Stieleria varia]TWT98690.1 hypothetical protein Pla52n_52070 [Stieleria varia]
MRFFCSLAFLLSISWSGEGTAQEKESAHDIVYQGLADMTVARDEVLKRYALMVQGESQVFYSDKVKGRPPVRIFRIYRLKARSSAKDLEYSAHGRVIGIGESNQPFEFQTWTELFTCGGKTEGRNGAASARGYMMKEKDISTREFVKKNALSAVNFDAFDDLVLHPMFLQNPMEQFGWIEQVFLREGELIEAQRVVQGEIHSKWRSKHHTLDFEIEMWQSKACDYMPVRLTYKSKIPNMPNLFGNTEISWKKNDSGKLLPHVLKAASGSPFDLTQEQHHWVFNWRVGKQVPNEFFDCESKDFRLQFTPLFEFYFDTYAKPGGRLTGSQWKTPQEILSDSDPK